MSNEVNKDQPRDSITTLAIQDGERRVFFPTQTSRRKAWLVTNAHILVLLPMLTMIAGVVLLSLRKADYGSALVMLGVGAVVSGGFLAVNRALQIAEYANPLRPKEIAESSEAAELEYLDPGNLRPLAGLGIAQSILFWTLLGGDLPGNLISMSFAAASVIGLWWARRTRLRVTNDGLEVSDPARSIQIHWDDLVVAERLMPRLDPQGRRRTALLLMSRSQKTRAIVVATPKIILAIRPRLSAMVPADRFLTPLCTIKGAAPSGSSEVE